MTLLVCAAFQFPKKGYEYCKRCITSSWTDPFRARSKLAFRLSESRKTCLIILPSNINFKIYLKPTAHQSKWKQSENLNCLFLFGLYELWLTYLPESVFFTCKGTKRVLYVWAVLGITYSPILIQYPQEF